MCNSTVDQLGHIIFREGYRLPNLEVQAIHGQEKKGYLPWGNESQSIMINTPVAVGCPN